MATQFIIAKPDERTEWIPITMTMHDDVVLVRIPRRPSPKDAPAPTKRPSGSPSTPATFVDFADDGEPTWEDAEWQ